jgi:hypothetical protein
MNPLVGWSLAGIGSALATFNYGWPGLALAFSVIVFWLLLQFSRALRVLRDAGQIPKGTVGSAVMLHTQLKPGMQLLQILALTRSLGHKVADDPETFVWRDDSGAAVRAELRNGRLARWELQRPETEASAAAQTDHPAP